MVKATLYLGKLSNGEFRRLVTSLLRDWQGAKVTVEDAVLTKLKNRLTEELSTFAEGLADLKDNQTAKAIEEADKLRDQQLQLLADTIKLGRYGLTSEEKEAYKLLNPLFKDLKKVKQSNYEEESAAILKLLDQLKKAELQAPIKTLNVTKPIQNVTKSQEAFDLLLAKRQSTRTSKVVYDNKAARKALQETYTKLSDYLYVMADEATPVAYGKLYKVFKANNDAFKPLTADKKKKADAAVSPSPEEAASSSL